MFESIKTFLNNIELVETSDSYIIKNVRADFIKKDLKRVFKITSVSDHLFNITGQYSFSFYKFFAPEILFSLDRLIEHYSLQTPIRTLYKIRQLLLEKTLLSRLTLTKDQIPKRLNRSKLNDFFLTPLDFQYELFDNYEEAIYKYNLKGYLFAGAAGSGKTFTGLALTHCLDHVDQVVCVVPSNSLNRVWETSIKTLFKTPPTYWISNSDKPLLGNEKYVIIHYEYLTKLLDQLSKLKGHKFAVILDESHNFNEIVSLRTNYFIDLCKRLNCSDILWLSGTPIKAISMEVIPLITCIDPLFTEEVMAKFKLIYRGNNNEATQILAERIGIISYKVPKDRLNLEPPISKNVYIKFEGSEKYTLPVIKEKMQEFVYERTRYYKLRSKQDSEFFHKCLEYYKCTIINDKQKMIEYNTYIKYLDLIIKTNGFNLHLIKQELVYCNKFESKTIMPTLLTKEDRDAFKQVKSVIKYVNLKIQGECLGQIIGRARIQCHVDMTPHIPFSDIIEFSAKKTVIFSSFVDVIKKAKEVLELQDYNPVLIYAQSNSQLASILHQFETLEHLNPLVATYASLSTAVPLVMADKEILIDMPFRDYLLQQAISRVHRIGADTQVFVFYIMLDTGTEPNISSRSVDILKWSQEQTSELLGINSPFQIDDTIGTFETSMENYIDLIEGNYNNLKILEDKHELLNW